MRRLILVPWATAILAGCGTSASGAAAAATDAANDAATDANAPDGVSPDIFVTDLADDVCGDAPASGPFACGSKLTCEATQACVGTGQGVCGGPAPDASGNCGAGCSARQCGGGMHCLCTSYQCVDLPKACNDCTCAKTLANMSQCKCQDAGGAVKFDRPGAYSGELRCSAAHIIAHSTASFCNCGSVARPAPSCWMHPYHS